MFYGVHLQHERGIFRLRRLQNNELPQMDGNVPIWEEVRSAAGWKSCLNDIVSGEYSECPAAGWKIGAPTSHFRS